MYRVGSYDIALDLLDKAYWELSEIKYEDMYLSCQVQYHKICRISITCYENVGRIEDAILVIQEIMPYRVLRDTEVIQRFWERNPPNLVSPVQGLSGGG